jgi:hypothetical protein
MEGDYGIKCAYLSKNKAVDLFNGQKYYENKSSFDVVCNMREGSMT